MNKLRYVLTTLIIVVLSTILSAAFAQRVGTAAPEVILIDDEGGLIQLSDFAGTPVVLNAWASWCAPCVEELPFFERIYNEVNADAEEPLLEFFLVNNNEDAETALPFLREELGISLETGLEASKEQREAFKADGIQVDKTLDVIKNYRIRGMPTTFFIDAEGIIQAIKVGFITPGETRALLNTIGIDWEPLATTEASE